MQCLLSSSGMTWPSARGFVGLAFSVLHQCIRPQMGARWAPPAISAIRQMDMRKLALPKWHAANCAWRAAASSNSNFRSSPLYLERERRSSGWSSQSADRTQA
jgi:hypothetical protein